MDLAIRVLVAFAALALMASEMAFAENTNEHWNKTGLNETHLKTFLSQDKCYSSENSFLGCIDAINSILASTSPKKILTNENIQSLPNMGKVVAKVSGLKIQIYQDSKKSNFEDFRNASEEKKEITQSWKTYYNFTKSLAITEIFNKALSFKSNFRSVQVANAINDYYKTAVDPHTYIIPASERKEKQSKSENIFMGIGVQILKSKEDVLLKPKTNGPAMQAGIRSMDKLLKVNDVEVGSASVGEISEQIKGEENTPVTLTIARDGKILNFEILRMKYVEKNLEGQLLNDPLKKQYIAYIRIHSFSEVGVCQKFINAAIALKKKGAVSLVLDLRDNLGGLLKEGKCVASTYLNRGETIFTENDPATNAVKSTHIDQDGATLYNLYNNKPLIILMNGYSASSSEMVAGALRTSGRGIIIGERSYGKGTAQSEFEWKESGLESIQGITIMKTSARFHFANGSSNQLVGLTPDIEVYSSKNSSSEDSFVLRERDLYSNAVSAAPMRAFDSAIQTKAVESCIQKRNMIDSEYAENMNSHMGSDYQLSVAREAASCI